MASHLSTYNTPSHYKTYELYLALIGENVDVVDLFHPVYLKIHITRRTSGANPEYTYVRTVARSVVTTMKYL